jgi:hypothetical protein
MESEDGIADVVCHADHATDASTIAKQKTAQHGREHIGLGMSYDFYKDYSVLPVGNNSLLC